MNMAGLRICIQRCNEIFYDSFHYLLLLKKYIRRVFSAWHGFFHAIVHPLQIRLQQKQDNNRKQKTERRNRFKSYNIIANTFFTTTINSIHIHCTLYNAYSIQNIRCCMYCDIYYIPSINPTREERERKKMNNHWQ